MFNARFWHLAHAYLTIFFLPMAAIYAVTGICYICGYKGTVTPTAHTVTLQGAPPATAAAKLELIKRALDEQNIPLPAAAGRDLRDRFTVGPMTRTHAILEPIPPGADTATVILNRPDLFYRLVLLHKAKGGTLFNYFAIAFGVTFLLMYLSGILIIWKSRPLCVKLTVCFALGLLATLLAIASSL